jgi:hypothetical protein
MKSCVVNERAVKLPGGQFPSARRASGLRTRASSQLPAHGVGKHRAKYGHYSIEVCIWIRHVFHIAFIKIESLSSSLNERDWFWRGR